MSLTERREGDAVYKIARDKNIIRPSPLTITKPDLKDFSLCYYNEIRSTNQSSSWFKVRLHKFNIQKRFIVEDSQ